MKNNLFAKTNFGLTGIVALHFALVLFNLNYFVGKSSILTQHQSKDKKTRFGVFYLNDEDMNWIDSTVRSMPLYEKCAQVFMPAVFNRNLDTSSLEFKNTLDLVKNHGIGGIVISSGGIKETAIMLNELQKNAKIPLLVSADFENGVGMRLYDAITYPLNMALGATNNPHYAYQTGKAIGKEASIIGVNLNFAPVADVNNNPENPVINLRSYSEDKDLVYKFCSEFVKGSIDAGIIATAKHFPGHGNTKIDSHYDLPVIMGSKEYLYENELYPFRKLIDEGLQAIMIGHLSVPAFESEKNLPSSLSYNIITKLLKQELGFEGLIITDALDMKAVTNYFSDDEAVVKAFEAGNDILLMPPDTKTGIKALYEAVKSGKISESRLDESVKKILAAKRWLKLYKINEQVSGNLVNQLKIPEHIQLAKEIADNSVTLLKMESDLYPLNPDNFQSVYVIDITNRLNPIDTIFYKLAESDLSVSNVSFFSAKSKLRNYQEAINFSKKNDLILIASFFTLRNNGDGVPLSEHQQEFLNKILELNKKVIFISFENPYILSMFPENKNYICTFGNVEASDKAVLDLLLGRIIPNSQLPISIPSTEFKIGYKWNRDK
jgi:beta-N-acetylhexosaminidase